MSSLFVGILRMSITSSYVILFVILARLLIRKAPKIFSYALWFVVLFRLICPFSYESIFSFIPNETSNLTSGIIPTQLSSPFSSTTGLEMADGAVQPTPLTITSADPSHIHLTLISLVWVLGLVLLLGYSLYTTLRLSRRLKSARLIRDNIYEVDSRITPFVFGIIRPRIYLPAGLQEDEKRYILLHEQTHIKRKDYLIKILAYMVLCVHWFNPLVWLSFFLMSGDMELSCDERVIKQMGSRIKKDYSISLLALSTGRRIVGGCPIAFGENNTKGRIVNILNYRKPTFWMILVSIIAVSILSIGLMSNPKDTAESIKPGHETTNEKISFTTTGPVSGFIREFDQENNTFTLDEFEWITLDDEERIKELGLNPNEDMPGGFYIHMTEHPPYTYEVNDETTYTFLDWTSELEQVAGTQEDLIQFIETHGGMAPINILVENGVAISLEEQYIP